MSEKEVKLVRKQLRNICQELMPIVLTNELAENIKSFLTKRVDERLKEISEQIKATLDVVEKRSKDTQSLIVRATTQPQNVATEPSAPEQK